MFGEILGTINAVSLGVLSAYAVRQHLFALTTLLKRTKDPYSDYKPNHTVSILIPARNEEKVIGRALEYMSRLDYPVEKMEILVLNDASTDRTSEIAHEWSQKYPHIRVIDRPVGGIGKGDVMNEGIRESKNEIIFVFDADYTPAPDTIRRLMAWFDDPKIGLVQGKIHVVNKDENLLTKMTHAERSGGFCCDLYARDILRVSNQYGGTVGGFRRSLIDKIGPWEPRIFCEDTDLTCRTLLAGYKVKYDVSVNCGEEAPDRLKVYYGQRYRWIRGHTICGLKYTKKFILSPFLSLREKIEGVLWLNLNCIPAFVMASLAAWLLHIFVHPASFMLAAPMSYIYLVFTLMGLVSMVIAGLQKAHQLRYLKYVVLMLVNSYPMCFAVSLKAYIDIITNRPLKWTKTERNGIMT